LLFIWARTALPNVQVCYAIWQVLLSEEDFCYFIIVVITSSDYV